MRRFSSKLIYNSIYSQVPQWESFIDVKQTAVCDVSQSVHLYTQNTQRKYANMLFWFIQTQVTSQYQWLNKELPIFKHKCTLSPSPFYIDTEFMSATE